MKIFSMLSNFLEKFGVRSTVKSIEKLGENVVQVKLHSIKFKTKKFEPGLKLEVHVGGVSYRSYTAAKLDNEKEEITCIICLNGRGQGSHWASHLSVGDKVTLFVTNTKISLKKEKPSFFFLGDETALGAFSGILSFLPKTAEISGAVEVDDESILKKLNLPLEPLIRSKKLTLEDWLKGEKISSEAQVFVIGESKMVGKLRRELKSRQGVNKSNLYAEGYWKA